MNNQSAPALAALVACRGSSWVARDPPHFIVYLFRQSEALQVILHLLAELTFQLQLRLQLVQLGFEELQGHGATSAGIGQGSM